MTSTTEPTDALASVSLDEILDELGRRREAQQVAESATREAKLAQFQENAALREVAEQRQQYPYLSEAHDGDDADFRAAVARHRDVMRQEFLAFFGDPALVSLIAAQDNFAGEYDEAGPDAGEIVGYDFIRDATDAIGAVQQKIERLKQRADAEQPTAIGAVWLPEVRRSPGSVTRPSQGLLDITVSGHASNTAGTALDSTLTIYWSCGDTRVEIKVLAGEARSVAAILTRGADMIDIERNIEH